MAVTALDDYLFDLRGYLILKQALESSLVDALSAALDAAPPLEPSGWWGNVHRADDNPDRAGVELQNIVEGGEPFERLIDHPSSTPAATARRCAASTSTGTASSVAARSTS